MPTERSLRGEMPAAIGLLGVAALFFREALLTDKTFYFRDATTLIYPARRFLADLIKAGEWPLWNPYVQSGSPLAADVLHNVFHPLTLLYLLLPFDVAFKAFVLVHIPIAGLALYALARHWEVGRPAALTGAIAFMLSGPVLTLTSVPNFLAGLAWTPLTVLVFIRALQSTRRGPLILAGALLALQAVSDPHVAYMTGSALIVWMLMSLGRPWTRALWRGAWRLAAVAGLAILLAAIQLVPLAELYRESVRAGGVAAAEAAQWSLPPWRLIEVLFPRLLGDPAGETYWLGLVRRGHMTPWLLSVYVGTATVFLAAVGATEARRRVEARYLLGLVLGAGTLALGDATPVHGIARAVVPLFNVFRYPEKWWFLAAFGLCGLAALGVNRVGHLRPRWISCLGGVVLLAGVVSVALASARPWQQTIVERLFVAVPAGTERRILTEFILELARRQFLLTGAFCAVTAGSVVLAGRAGSLRPLGPWLLVLVATLDMFVSQHALVPLWPAAFHNRPAPILAYLPSTRDRPYRVEHVALEFMLLPNLPTDERGRSGRMAWLVEILFPETGLRHRVQTTIGTGTPLDAYRALAARFVSLDRYVRFLSLWNVEFLVTLTPPSSPDLVEVPLPEQLQPVRLYRNPGALPRAWVVPEWLVAKERREALAWVTEESFDPRTRVVLEGEDAPPPAAAGGPWPERQVRVVTYAPHEVVLDVGYGPAGMLVLADAYYPGWRAWVDGQSVKIWRANVAMRAVEIGPGTHRVRFTFRPMSPVVGGGVSLLTVVTVVWVIVRERSRPPR